MSDPDPPGPASVAVVDGSGSVRRLVREVVESDPDFCFVGEASTGTAGLELIAEQQPTVAVIEIHMPAMSGFDALPRIAELSPETRVILFSHSNPKKSKRLDEIIRRGVAEFVPKPTGGGDIEDARAQLNETLMPCLRLLRTPKSVPKPSSRPWSLTPAASERIEIVMIGSSTGGPGALECVLSKMPANFPVPILIVQHIADDFSGSLVEHLNRVSPLSVVEAKTNMIPEPGMVYVAPGRSHMNVVSHRGRVTLRLFRGVPVNFCRPSVDVLLNSSAPIYGPRQLAVILTGMGHDGLNGVGELVKRGAPVLAQDEATSVVWGMPGAVVEAGLADEVLPLDVIASRVQRWVATSHSGRRKRKAAQNV